MIRPGLNDQIMTLFKIVLPVGQTGGFIDLHDAIDGKLNIPGAGHDEERNRGHQGHHVDGIEIDKVGHEPLVRLFGEQVVLWFYHIFVPLKSLLIQILAF